MFIQTEATPNPATLKFLPGRAVLDTGTADYRSIDEAGQSPLAQSLFGVEGVAGVFLGADFIAVSKDEGQEWQHMKPAILGAVMEHFMSGTETISSDGANDAAGLNYDADDEDTVQTIKELLDTRVRPAVAQDGGDITFHGFREGVVYLSMRGACAGCPSSTATLQGGIENLLRHFCPDVQEVRAV